jgi:enoyl-CoA hydratase/carnithine racemase
MYTDAYLLDYKLINELAHELKAAINDGGFQCVVVFSAGMGFLAGAYEESRSNNVRGLVG